MRRKINYTPQEKLLKGAEKLYKAVSPTLGPKGMNVLIERLTTPHPTKDGITVAKQFVLQDATENIAAQLIKTAAATVVDQVGDGTTSATILSYKLFKEAAKADTHPVETAKTLDKDLAVIREYVQENSKPITSTQELYNIAYISCNNDHEQANLVVNAFDKAGQSGMILVDDSKTNESTITISRGYHIHSSYVSPYFITDEKTSECVLDNPIVFLYTKRLKTIQDILETLEYAVKNDRPVLFVAEQVDYQVLTTLIHNMTVNPRLRVCAIHPPAYGIRNKQILEDVAALTGATLIDEDKGMLLKDQLTYLGQAKKITVNKNTTIIESDTDTTNYVTKLQEVLENVTDSYNKEHFTERIAKLTNGLVTINIAANTKSEALEKKDRLDDGIRAVRAAISDGVSIGAGITYLKASDSPLVSNISKQALKSIFYQININANIDPNITYPILKNSNYTQMYDLFNDRINDVPTDVIDPTKSLLVILEQAYTAAKLLLTTAVVIEEDPEKNDFTE